MFDDWNDNSGATAQDGGGGYNNQSSSFRNWRSGGAEQNRERSGGGRGRGGPRGPPRQDDSDATVIKVPSRFVGRIIGRGGSKISDLQFESGARINVTKTTEGDETIVKLFGDGDAVAKAEGLIRELTIDRERDGPAVREYSQPPQQYSYSQAPQQYSYSQAPHQQYSYSQAPQQEYQPVESGTPMNWQQMLKASDEAEKERWSKLPPIKKQFYVEHPTVTAMSEEEVRQFRLDNNNIVVERTFTTENSRPVPKPVTTFEQAFYQYPDILREIAKAGFTTPSPIQTQAWPVLLSGEDLIGIAQTGTGKTLAFLLPALIHIDGQEVRREERPGPAVLVMAPTRELALQIDKEVKKYEYKGITALCIYGGGNRREQIKTLTTGVDIIVATPGRLNDLIEAGHLNVQYVTYVVLDEADRMLDMGFEPQIRKVMYSIRPTRQTVMTSATWPPGVRRLAQSYMVDPIQVYVGTLDLAATHTVSQIIEIMPDSDEDKLAHFMDFVRNLDTIDKAIVFCGKKARADNLASELILAGLNCQTIHGDRDQSDREQALIDIKEGKVQVLIATDVASRGLDIDDITHVINYDFPRNIEEYVHRVGRTGRAGKSGTSISYLTRADWSQAKDLIGILEEAQQFVPDEVFKMADRYAAWKEKKDAQRPERGRGRYESRW